MKRIDLLKQVVPLDLEGLEVLDGEMLFVTGGFCAAAVAIATTLFVTGYKLRH